MVAMACGSVTVLIKYNALTVLLKYFELFRMFVVRAQPLNLRSLPSPSLAIYAPAINWVNTFVMKPYDETTSSSYKHRRRKGWGYGAAAPPHFKGAP